MKTTQTLFANDTPDATVNGVQTGQNPVETKAGADAQTPTGQQPAETTNS